MNKILVTEFHSSILNGSVKRKTLKNKIENARKPDEEKCCDDLTSRHTESEDFAYIFSFKN